MRTIKQIMIDNSSNVPLNKISDIMANAYSKLKQTGDLETYKLTSEEVIRRYGNEIPFNIIDPYGWSKLNQLAKEYDTEGNKLKITPNLSYDDAWAMIDELELLKKGI